MGNKKITQIKDAQTLVKNFAKRNNWKDIPNVDLFDHLHEELIEMSQFLRYKSAKERTSSVKKNKKALLDGIGDMFFGICRLANQLNVDLEEAFDFSSKDILKKYHRKSKENNR